MTLPLIDSWNIQPVKGGLYPVNTTCANPFCDNDAEHGHHLVRRTKIIGNTWWVRLPGGIVIGNVIGLCAPCHALVTNQGGRGGGHGAAIRWINGDLWWCAVDEGDATSAILYVPLGICDPQTPHAGDDVILGLDTGPRPCPVCGHSSHGRKGPKREARKRKSWTVRVPDDEEDGAQVLDDIVDGIVAAFELDLDGGPLTRYHALARAGAFVLINQSEIPKEAKG